MSRHPLKGLRVHVEGMGITGCLLAYHLERWGCRWSWHDIDAPITAWRASTGAIFQAGAPSSLDDQCYRVWERWLEQPALGARERLQEALRVAERPYPMQFFERAAYWFSTKQPPHGGRYQFDGPTSHGLRNARPFSYHLNAQKFVPHTRKHFGGLQRDPLLRARHEQNADVYVVAHGFSKRLDHVLWGWAVPVQLRYDKRWYDTACNRACFYFREGRFLMAYAYPIAGTSWWYAGSSLIVQQRPKQLEVQPKYERWKREFERLGGGAVKVLDRAAELQGWRPAEGDAHVEPRVKKEGKKLFVPPLWHSGIRHFPRVLQGLMGHMDYTKHGAR